MINPYEETLKDKLWLAREYCKDLLVNKNRVPSDVLVHARWLVNNLSDERIKDIVSGEKEKEQKKP